MRLTKKQKEVLKALENGNHTIAVSFEGSYFYKSHFHSGKTINRRTIESLIKKNLLIPTQYWLKEDNEIKAG